MKGSQIQDIIILVACIVCIQLQPLSISPLYAQNLKSVEVDIDSLNFNIPGARIKAIEIAKKKAIAESSDFNISSDDILINNRLSFNRQSLIPYLSVIDFKLLGGDTGNIQNSSDHIKIEVKIRETFEGIDSNFRIAASINESVYKENEKIFINIIPNKDSYIYAFIIYDDDKVLKLIPNQFKANYIIGADNAFTFPDDEYKKYYSDITASLEGHKGQDTVYEKLYIIAVSEKPAHDVNLDRIFKDIPDFIQGPGHGAYLRDVVRELVNIPLKNRTEEIIYYKIVKK